MGTEKERIVKHHSYSVPQYGGNFFINDFTFNFFPFLSKFAEMKINAVRLIDAMNSSQLFQQKQQVSVMAVQQELSNVAASIMENNYCMNNGILTAYNQFNRHSLVPYNVGLYQDTFSHDSASFENKLVLKIPKFNVKNSNWNLGRGGGKVTGEFCVGLLDWGVGKTRRGKAIDYGIITHDQRLTHTNLRTFFRIILMQWK